MRGLTSAPAEARRWSFPAGVAVALLGVSLAYLPVGPFYLFILSRAAASLLAVAGLNLALGYTGLFSFGHISLYAMGAYATTLAVTDHDLPVGVGFALAMVVGGVGGCILGLATFRARATHFAVVSLVLMFAVSELLNGWTSLTHGGVGVNVRRPAIGAVQFGQENRRYWLLALGIAVLGVLALRNLIRSPLGRALVAVRESPDAAAALGVNPFRYRLLALGFGGALAGMGGAVFAHLDGYVSPQLAGFVPGTLLVVSLLVGGQGTMWGPLVGVGVLEGIDRGLDILQDSLPGLDIIVFQQLISGLILFAVIVALPRGLAGTISDRIRRDVVRLPEAGEPEGRPPIPLFVPRRPSPAGRPALEVRGLTKDFGGVRAVDRLDLVVEAGTIHGLIGPNGSGKTTTVNLITGAIPADDGEVWFLGQLVARPRPAAMAALGLSRVFQRAEVFGSTAVIDNVLVGFHLLANRNLVANVLRTPGTRRSERRLLGEARALTAALGLHGREVVRAASLPYGDRRLLEAARAIAARPALLVLDEPATGLTTAELLRLSAVLEALRAAGVTVLLIEHNMEFLMELCDRVSVLDYGRKIAEGTPAEIQSHPQVLEAYLGALSG